MKTKILSLVGEENESKKVQNFFMFILCESGGPCDSATPG